MSNYYKSDCCGVPADIIDYPRKLFKCQKCHLPCKVIAVLDTPGGVPTADESVKQYQEDIKAGVDVGGHETEELVV
jgi:hypothetical protein